MGIVINDCVVVADFNWEYIWKNLEIPWGKGQLFTITNDSNKKTQVKHQRNSSEKSPNKTNEYTAIKSDVQCAFLPCIQKKFNIFMDLFILDK